MTTFLERFGGLFDSYDDMLLGDIDSDALFKLYRELRSPGVRVAQVKASIESVCGEGALTLDKLDFEDGLGELDRRYFLLQDLIWEFKVLARADGLVTEEDAKLLFEATHERNFSRIKYDAWLKSRIMRGAGVSFNEIDVLLCNKPTPDEIIAELPTLPREQTELGIVRSATTVITDGTRLHDKKKKLEKLSYLKKLQELKAKRSENLKQRKEFEEGYKVNKQKSDELRRQEAEQMKAEEERRRAEEIKAEERVRLEALQKEKEDRKRNLEAEKIADEDRKKKEESEKEEEIERLKQLEKKNAEEKQRREEEAAAVEEADRLALEELADRTTGKVLLSKKEDEIAQRHAREAEEELNRAKAAADKEAIEEAQRKKKEADLRAKKSSTIKRLTTAIQSRDLNELEPAITSAKKYKFDGTEEYINEAEELVELLYSAVTLDKATRERQIEEIEDALNKIRKSNFDKILAKEVNAAEILLVKLKRLEFLKRQVMELKQQTIAELKSYQKPPPIVKFVMTATFLILGHDAKALQHWNQMVVLMGKTGKEGLKRRIQSYEPDGMSWEVAEACQEILAGMDTGSVADVSAGAAAFYIWCDGMVEERLSLPKVIPIELKQKRRASLNRQKSNQNLMKGGTVEVVSRRSRSRDKIEAPKTKPDRNRSTSKGAVSKSKGAASKSPGPRKRK